MKLVAILAALGFVAYAIWQAFGRARRHASARDNWKNEDFASREKDGTWAEGSTMASDSSAPPIRMDGAGTR